MHDKQKQTITVQLTPQEVIALERYHLTMAKDSHPHVTSLQRQSRQTHLTRIAELSELLPP